MQPPQAPFTCGSTNQYAFCAPNGAGDYYIAIPQNQPAQNDVNRIRSWFENQNGTPELITTPPAGIDSFEHARVYRVTDFIPKFILTRNGTRDDVVGPNCYQAARTAAGYTGFEGRYVHTDEFKYYLARDFTPVYCPKAGFGSFVVYDTSLIQFDAGDHAAFTLLGGLVFQKGGWQNYYPYEISTIDGAMQAVESWWRPAPEDRFGGPTTSGIDPEDYKYMCYDRLSAPRERETSSTARDREWFMPLFQYYSARIQDVSNLTWTAFKDNRIDLLTIENMWRVLREFGDRVGNFNVTDVLLTIDDPVAEEYLKLESLSWQYDVMSQTYNPIKNRWQLEDLYRAHYVIFDEHFYEELDLYLTLLKVPQSKRAAVTTKFVERIKSYDPVLFAPSSGSQGIPYLDILKEVIASN